MEISTSTYLRGWQSLSVTIVKSCVLLGAEQERCSSSSFITYTISGVAEEMLLPYQPRMSPRVFRVLKKKQPQKLISGCVRQSQLGHDKRDADGNVMVPL